MALIECNECNQKISDTAASCPGCGAAVPRTLRDNELECPHCMTVVNKSAFTCPGCRAKKGYIYSGRDGAFGFTGTIAWGIVVPIILTVVLPFFAIITVPLFLYALIGLLRGPRWYASRHAS